MNITCYSKGAAEEVTGSRHYLKTDETLIQIDCGAFQGRRAESEEKNRAVLDDIENPDAVVLTHAHFDHSGMIPLLTKGGYRGNIYATPATRDLASLIMMDSAKIQARDIEYLKKQAAKAGEQFTKEPFYSSDDAATAMHHFVTLSYRRPMWIGPKVELELYEAGHILGSSQACFTVHGENGKKLRVAYTGDLGRKNKAIIRDPDIVEAPDYLFLDSTYGNRLHEKADDAMEELAEVVSSTAEKGGKVVIPAFAVERTQELVFYLHLLTDQKRIPDIPIFVDSPMATNATSIFRVHPECYDQKTQDAFIQHNKNPFGFNNLRYTSSVEESKAINNVKGPAVIISADGMCEAGRIRHHLVQTIEDRENTILIVGFMAKHTLGRRIVDRNPEVRMFGRTFKVRARVKAINAFSAHADYQEISEYVHQLDAQKLKGVFLVHGEPDAQKHLKKVLEKQGVPRVEIVQYGKSIHLS